MLKRSFAAKEPLNVQGQSDTAMSRSVAFNNLVSSVTPFSNVRELSGLVPGEKRIDRGFRYSGIRVSSGRSTTQDAAGGLYVKPKRLLLSEGVSTSGRSAIEGSRSLYFITVSTSQDDKSDISEPNVGILVAMIGDDGDAILRTIPPVDLLNPSRFQTRFLAGSKDNDVFVGAELGRLAALWVAPEKGTWRPAQVRVLGLQWSEDFDRIDEASRRDLNTLLELMSNILRKSPSMPKWKGFVYLFDSNEKLLGTDDEKLAAEIRPSVREYSDPDSLRADLLGSSIKSGKTPSPTYLSRDEIERLRALSMEEYEAMKLQFLGISSLLVGLGTAAYAVFGEDRLTESFAVGGLGGFLYLLLLQKFVDQLPGPTSLRDDGQEGSDSNKSPTGVLGGAKVPISIALVAGITLLVARIAQGGASRSLTPQMLVAGVGGFLTSRVAVIVASLRAKASSNDD